MNILIRLISCLAILQIVRPGAGAEIQLSKHRFSVPDGFEIELIAGPPLVNRPIEADFDELGRLYVTDSSGSNEKVQKQLETKPHRIVRLEDTDGDGKFDKSIEFADRMMFPEGAMWHDGSLYVSAPPSIWKLTDTDGDGVADEREEWFQGKTLTGCANDLHGPYLGRDGWIYWSKGAFAKQTYERPGQSPFVTRAAHIFRSRPDGTGIEPVMTGGMDNPVGVTFLPTGERIFTTTFFQHPGGGQRDGLIHAIYGGVYGKVHDVIEDHKRTGDLMPVLTHFGPAAPCGILCYSSQAFGTEFSGNLFSCLFNLQKIVRTVLEPNGATFTAHDRDFLVSDNTDFHPTDILEDADGSLIVIDTGGWYKLCCPTSQLWKPDVLGAIYRVRRVGASKPSDPRGLQLTWESMKPDAMAELLGDNRHSVRQRAIASLAEQGSEAVPALSALLRRSENEEARLNAVWALTRIDDLEAREAVRKAFEDSDEVVRHAAAHSAGAWRDKGAVPQLVTQLRTGSPPLQRSAAEALGRIGDSSAVAALVQAAASCTDRILEHSLIYALIEIGDPIVTTKLVDQTSAATQSRRVALIALDQMDGGNLKPEMVTPLLMSGDPILNETAVWIVGHHPKWARDLAGFFKRQLMRENLSEQERTELRRLLGQFSGDETTRDLLAATVRESALMSARISALEAMADSGLKTPPDTWLTSVTRVLGETDSDLVQQAVTTARSWADAKERNLSLTEALLEVAHDADRLDEIRLQALAAVPKGLSTVDSKFFEFLSAKVGPDQPVMMRTTASGVFAKAGLNRDQLLRLTEIVRNSGPLELPKLLESFLGESDEKLGLALLNALRHSSGLYGLHRDTIKETFEKHSELLQKQAQELIASLNADAETQKARLDEIAKALASGDIRRGQAVFNGAKAACSSCHAIGYLGGDIGPDLTRIGQIRTERDLLEAIVYPSASIVRSYEPMIVETHSGEDYGGVLRRNSADEIVLATGPGVEVSIARSDVFEMRPSTVSTMPGGMDEQLNTQELADLVAFLRATRR